MEWLVARQTGRIEIFDAIDLATTRTTLVEGNDNVRVVTQGQLSAELFRQGLFVEKTKEGFKKVPEGTADQRLLTLGSPNVLEHGQSAGFLVLQRPGYRTKPSGWETVRNLVTTIFRKRQS